MTIRRIDHTAIAVRDLDEAIGRYGQLYDVGSVERAEVADQGVEVAFLALGDTYLELISPLEESSSIARFLEKRGEGLHHIGLLVGDLETELDRLEAEGVELIDQRPRPGVHGRIAFVHPRGTGGILVELVEHNGPSKSS